ncbi:XRE family transcriptional regulator [Listeria monocytogenes]|nr:helix-turn-helix transcriptional regulator [Listeria monocytogenes]EAG6788678.1 XRE family transcriptional regulator [Listeria monocytogenes]EAH2707691.1 XRE family transcriptional regulator [Listeria monocytogenes]EAH3602488.1 XRE family transcriptional regulator [Listeria monocytogenes]EHM4248155.1 helix-turn-helix transcriptional regulator [Listeria monocytogenes]EIM4564617.1 helix-turn-helix transcriptional regulator [Listeria monocytogenes]
MLKKLRKNENLTQDQLASKIGITRDTLANYETGRREPDFTTLKNIASYFEVSTDYLLGRDEIDNSDLLAAHIDNDLTEDERIEIEKYLKFIRSQKEE